MAQEKVISYKFDQIEELSNPDGSNIAKVQGCKLSAGPGKKTWGNFPYAFDFEKEGRASLKLVSSIFNLNQFSVRVLFQAKKKVKESQALIECNSLPVKVYLHPDRSQDGSDFKVQLWVKSKLKGWVDCSSEFVYSFKVGTWYALELIYDKDTLAMMVDQRLIVLQAFTEGGLTAGGGSHLHIGSWLDGKGYHFSGKIAYLQISNGISKDGQNKINLARLSPNWFISYKYDELLKRNSSRRKEGGVVYSSAIGGWYQRFHQAIIFHHSDLGTYSLQGAIRDYYLSFLSHGEMANLGPLVSDPIEGLKNREYQLLKSRFQKGCIYYNSKTDKNVRVFGEIYRSYVKVGEELSELGLPLKDQEELRGGQRQRFSRGEIYYKNRSHKAYILLNSHGILKGFKRDGGPEKRGYPISDSQAIQRDRDFVGYRADFEKCTYFWSLSSGAHFVEGSIRDIYYSEGGVLGYLGFPKTNQLSFSGKRKGTYNCFQKGTIVHFNRRSGSSRHTTPQIGKDIFVCRPFKLRVGRIKSRKDLDDFPFKNECDLYAYVELKDLKRKQKLLERRFPKSGSYSDRNRKDLNYEIPIEIIPNQGDKTYEFRVKVKDADTVGTDDVVGDYKKKLSLHNAWGLADSDQGIYYSETARYLTLSWSIKVEEREGDYYHREWNFWDFSGNNSGVNPNPISRPLNWDKFADAFSDVDSNPSLRSPLDLIFYNLFVKNIPTLGNCFGMCLEAANIWKNNSIFSQPVSKYRWSSSLEREINIKQVYQVGDNAISWFLRQFFSGNSHNPISVYEDSRRLFHRGVPVLIRLCQNYSGGGKVHFVLPYEWSYNGDYYSIRVYDPNLSGDDFKKNIKGPPFKSCEIRIFDRGERENKFMYIGVGNTRYRGDRWSGGRLVYYPWNILNETQETPTGDILSLLHGGLFFFGGESASTVTIKDEKGENIDGRKLKAGANPRKHFVPLPLPETNQGEAFIFIPSGRSNSSVHRLKASQKGHVQFAIKYFLNEVLIEMETEKGEVHSFENIRKGSTKGIKYLAKSPRHCHIYCRSIEGLGGAECQWTLKNVSLGAQALHFQYDSSSKAIMIFGVLNRSLSIKIEKNKEGRKKAFHYRIKPSSAMQMQLMKGTSNKTIRINSIDQAKQLIQGSEKIFHPRL